MTDKGRRLRLHRTEKKPEITLDMVRALVREELQGADAMKSHISMLCECICTIRIIFSDIAAFSEAAAGNSSSTRAILDEMLTGMRVSLENVEYLGQAISRMPHQYTPGVPKYYMGAARRSLTAMDTMEIDRMSRMEAQGQAIQRLQEEINRLRGPRDEIAGDDVVENASEEDAWERRR